VSQSEQREEAVFEAVLQLPAPQRAAYLDQTCAGDADLRERVEALLGAFERAGGFLKQPAVSTPARTLAVSLPPTEKPGDRIGRYKLLEQIGEGGCGVVYVAEQEAPVRRRVALKIIKLGMGTKQVIARFDAERQALAMMDHPNIAKIHDAGATETGRPYFVMELVRGIKITDYCDQNHLSPRERLDLFIQVCRAIQHAHQKGVIHRDIKPSNVLVASDDGVPVPKVIDFGIAKATQGRLTDQTVYTAFEQFIGTPAYMSPEQAALSLQDIDTRSDIYSLGVLLYELLTGTTPFDAKELLSKGLDEMRRTIREVEPVKPSSRLTKELNSQSEIRNQKSEMDSALRTSHSTIPSDLDWIVMKCLEKDRTRRYETANGLAADIARHLNNEAIIARPPTRLYRFQKALRRNKLVFATGTIVFVALVCGSSIAVWSLAREKKAGLEAESARASELKLLRKEEARSRLAEARNFFNQGKQLEAEKLLNEIRPELIEPESEQIGLRRQLAWEFAKQEKWTKCLSNFMVAVQIGRSKIGDHDVAVDHYCYVTALIVAQDFRTYDNFRRELLSARRYMAKADGAEFLCRITLMTPADEDFLRSLAPCAEMAAARTNYTGSRPQDQQAVNNFALALFAYRTGNDTNALRWANEAIAARAIAPTVNPCAHALRAMAFFRLGQIENAKSEINLSEKTVKPVFDKGVFAVTQNAGRAFEWYHARYYLNEAKKMIGDLSSESP
jgi:eukaryotic-like serine/threonine-protein kinase